MLDIAVGKDTYVAAYRNKGCDWADGFDKCEWEYVLRWLVAPYAEEVRLPRSITGP